jgi:hypothetical protein
MKILLIGDSHALMYHSTFSAIRQTGYDLYVRSITTGLCPNFSGTRSLTQDPNNGHTAATNRNCEEQHKKVLAYAKTGNQSFDFLVLSDSTAFFPRHYVEDATEFAKSVKGLAKKTVILGQAPRGEDLATCLNKDYSNYVDCNFTKATSIHDYQVAKNAAVAYADLGSMFCIKNFCPMIGNSPIFARGHLTDAAGVQISSYFLEFLKEATVPRSS